MFKLKLCILLLIISSYSIAQRPENKKCGELYNILSEGSWNVKLYIGASRRGQENDSTIFLQPGKIEKNLHQFLNAKTYLNNWNIFRDEDTNLIIVHIEKYNFDNCKILSNSNNIELSRKIDRIEYNGKLTLINK